MRRSSRGAHLGVGFALVACGPLSTSDPAFWEPSHDLGGYPLGSGGRVPDGGGVLSVGGSGSGGVPPIGSGDAASGGSSGVPSRSPPPHECSFAFTVTTSTAGGRYSPRNVGAIWISNADGQFIKTLRTWGGPVRLPNATAWRTVSGGNAVDAVTGATRAGHGDLAASWDCTDASRNPVPHAIYRVSVTFADDNAVAAVAPPLHFATVDFDSGRRPLDLGVPNQPNFTEMKLVLR